MSAMVSKGSKFQPELLKTIKDAVNIIDVIGEHVVLRKSGSNYTGLCPFHGERTPSFSVSESKQLFYCYGCKKGGDTIGFVMDMFGVDFSEAVSDLAERARVPMPADAYHDGDTSDPEAQKRRAAAREKTALAYKLNRFAASFYHQAFQGSPEAQTYFQNRGVAGDLCRDFYVGYASPSWDALTLHLIEKKAPIEIALDLGLIRPSTKKAPGRPDYFDLFRNRGMFPILDMRGKVAGFGGRLMPALAGRDAGEDASSAPKYMNSPESPIFQKSKLVFGLYQAQKHIREVDEVIIVEGYFDVVALHAGGFRNVVATCGTSLTPEHLQLFRKFASRVTVLFDGDDAGVNATERAMELGLSHGMVLYGCRMPEDLDPDEVLFDQETGAPKVGGVEQMKAILAKSSPLLDQRIDEAVSKGSASPESRTQSLKQIGKWLADFKDPVGQEVRMETVQRRMNVSRQLLQQAMGVKLTPGAVASVSGQVRLSGPPRVRTSPPQRQGLTITDRALLGGFARRSAKFTELLTGVGGKLPPNLTLADVFESTQAHAFFEDLITNPAHAQAFREAPQQLLETELDAQVRSILTEAWVIVPEGDATALDADFHMALDRAIAKLWARFSQQIKSAITAAEAKKDANLQSELMKEYLDVQRKMKEFTNFYDEA